MTKKKKKLRLKIDFISCLVIVLGIVIVIYGGVYFKSNHTKSVSNKVVIENMANENKEEKTEEKLNINDTLVKDLYSKVTSSDGEYKYWMYVDYTENNDVTSDITISNVKEIVKMNFVGKNIDNSKAETVTCDGNVPDIVSNTRSVCSNNKRFRANENQIGYKKDYISSIYKSLYGTDLTPDGSIPLYVAPNSGEVYYYISAIDMYVKYYGEPNTVQSTGSYSGVLTNVKEENNNIKIYEDVTNGDNKLKFEYIFEKVDDANYKFVSRKKQN